MENYLDLKINETIDLIDEGNIVKVKLGKLFRESEDKFILTWNNGTKTELTSLMVENKQWTGLQHHAPKIKGVKRGAILYLEKVQRKIYRNTIMQYSRYGRYGKKLKKKGE